MLPERTRTRLRAAVTRTARLDKAAASTESTVQPAFYLGGVLRGDYCQLDAELVAIPEPSQAITADPREILLAGEQYLLTEKQLLRPRAEWPRISGRDGRIHRGVKSGHYPRLLARMASSNMVTFLPVGESVIENSLFGVWKEVGKSQRLIWGGNRSNPLFNEAAKSVELPTPDFLASLRLPTDQRLFLASCDISQFYNRLRAPEFLVPFFGLPRVRRSLLRTFSDLPPSDGYVVPCLRCIPMGATFAVNIAQHVSLAIVRRAGLGRTVLDTSSSRSITGGVGRQLVYIDDISAVGTSLRGVNKVTDRIVSALTAANLPTEPRKLQRASATTPSEALGLWWWGNGVLTVKPALSRKLRVHTEAIISRGRCSPQEMRRLCGLWVWACLLRRGLLAVMDRVYEFSNQSCPAKYRPLPRQVRVELNMLLDLFPAMYADIRMSDSSRVYATDASKTGGGVSYADLSPKELREFALATAEARVQKGWYSRLLDESTTFPLVDASDRATISVSQGFAEAFQSFQFKTAISTPWSNRSSHINVLEMEAFLLAVRHMRRSEATRGQRVLVFIDNTAVLGALAKGRSSSSALNRGCRRVIGAAIAADTQLAFH